MKKEKKQIVAGIRPVMEAIKAGKDIDRIYLKKGNKSELFNELFHDIRNLNIPFQFVPGEKLNRMSNTLHQGVVAMLAVIEYRNLNEVIQSCYEDGRDPFIVVLDQITDVRNFGAIARTAECAGVDALIIPTRGSVSLTSPALKTSAGALNRIAVCRSENLEETLVFLKESGLQIAAATEQTNLNYFAADMSGPVALILGSEEKGIRSGLLQKTDVCVRIPMKGEIESLNVSVAFGILAFEILRQRNSNFPE